jgi:hypothetical protein
MSFDAKLDFAMSDHPELGRAGHVCPFTSFGARIDTLRFGASDTKARDANRIRRELMAAFDQFDEIPHAYKSEWADDAAPVADYVVGFTPRGRIFARVWSGAARQRIKSVLKKMPARIGRVIWPLARIALRKRALLNGEDGMRDHGVTSSPSRFPESAS